MRSLTRILISGRQAPGAPSARRSEGRTELADHLSAEWVAAYRQRRLEPAQLLAADEHVAACPACLEALRGSVPRRGALLSLRTSLGTARMADDHVPGDRLRAYVEDRLDAADREIAESHLTICGPCRARAERFMLIR